MVEVPKPEPLSGRGGVWFGLGAQQLHVGVEAAFAPARKAHPALRVSAEDLEGLAERLSAGGAEVAWDHDLPGVRRFYTEDPWGNRLELLATMVAAHRRSASELERSGRHLTEVLALAEALPFRREEGLRYPRLPVVGPDDAGRAPRGSPPRVPGHQKDMSKEQNIAAQEHLAESINAGNVEAAVESFAPDCVDRDPAPGQGEGREGFKQFFTELTTAFPDAKIAPAHLVADDEHVCVAYTLTGTHEGPFHGIEPTGKAIEVRGVQIGRFEDGMIVERWGSTDELGIMHQIGAVPTP